MSCCKIGVSVARVVPVSRLQVAVEQLSESVHRLANFPDIEGGLPNDGITGHVSHLALTAALSTALATPALLQVPRLRELWFQHANDGMATVRPRG